MPLESTRRVLIAFRPDTWLRVREIFEQAIALPAAERVLYVEGVCGADAELRAEVMRLVDSPELGADLLATDAMAPLLVPVAAAGLEGHRLGPYQIGARLGAGGMGEVYRARDTRLDRTVALKVLPSHVSRDRHARDRFEREARAVAALNHPNICTLHDIGEAPDPAGASHDPIRFLVMEFVEGTTLDFPDELPLAPAQVIEIAAQVCDGLEAAHARGIVHRDLKPLNLMLTPRGQVKVLDFGVARLDSPAGNQAANASAIQTPHRAHRGHAGLHVAGAVERGPGDGRLGHLLAGPRALSPADRTASVRGGRARRAHAGAAAFAAGAHAEAAAPLSGECAARARGAGAAHAREGSGGALAGGRGPSRPA